MTLSLDLAEIGLHVFPWVFDSKGSKTPLTERGHLDATTDVEQIATWFAEYPQARVGVATGASGLVALDLDRKNGLDGFEAIDSEWLDVPAGVTYETNEGGGRHHVYLAPKGVRLNGQRNYRGMQGVDRRGGSSWIAWWGDAPKSYEEFTPAPQWLCDPAEERTGATFDGGLDEWLASVPEGDPTPTVAALEFPAVPFGHPHLIEAQFHLVRLAAEGHSGVAEALENLRAAWLTAPWDSDDYRYEFDAGLYGAIRKAGAQDSAIAALPPYLDTLNAVPAAVAETHLFGAEKPKRAYFDTIKALVRLELSDAQVATLVWHAPTTRSHARDWGIDYLYEQITEARSKAVEDAAPRENPSLSTKVNQKSVNTGGLLTDAERELVEACPTFVDRYLGIAAQRVNVLNTGYHVQNAWTILSLSFGLVAFLPYKSRPVGLNLYQIGMGESSSGKSESISIRDGFLREFFMDDMEFDLGSAVSTEWLHEKLITRDDKVSFFNADEAAKVFKKMNERGSYLAGLEDELAHYYENFISPVGKKGAAKEIVGKTAIVSFNLAMFGTPKRVTENLNRDMWLSGFLARVIWTIGDEPADNDAAYDESQGSEHIEEDEHDPTMRGTAVEMRQMRRLFGPRRPILATDEALRRMAKNRKAMTLQYRSHENWDLLEPSVKRLGDVIRKCSALLALSAGRDEVTLVDALTAISYAEVWLANVERISRQISDSQFTRDCDTIELFIRTSGGSVSETKIAHRFRTMGTGDVRDLYSRLEALRVQGRCVRQEATNTKGVWWAINEG